MKILLTTYDFPPRIGGPATFISHFARYLEKKGNRVTVVCVSDKKYPEIDRLESFKTHRIVPGFFKITFYIRKWLTLFISILINDKILINGLEVESASICRLLKKKFILKIVGDRAWEFGRNTSRTTLNIDEFQRVEINDIQLLKIREKMQKYVNAASLVYVPSFYLKGIVEGWGKNPDDIVVIHNSVPHQEIYNNSRNANSPFKLLFVGRITNWKGLELLLLAVNGIDNIKVTVCGDGPSLNTYQELNRRIGNQNVTFLGRVKPNEVNEYLRKTDILVLASLYEGLSHTLLEAISYGKPCLASNIGGNPEVIVHGYNGLLFDPYNHEELRNQIVKLKQDEEYYNELALNAKESSLKFDMESNYQKIEELLWRI